MNFEAYLVSKKIDGAAFEKAEPALYRKWEQEFSLQHPNSFTLQKLNLINPIRRKFQLKEMPAAPSATPATPVAPRPVIKPKPKIS